MNTFFPGTRAIVYDASLHKNDKATPPRTLLKPCTVVQWYGYESRFGHGKYPSLIDVRFDHRPDIVSKAHFTDMVEVVPKQGGL